MTLAVQSFGQTRTTAPDGFLRFDCPRCGRTILRYHPKLKGVQELLCPRTGVIGHGGGRGKSGKCGWKDYVYFNTTLEEVHGQV